MKLFSRSNGLNRWIWRKGSYIALLIALILSSCAPANQSNNTIVPPAQTPSPTPLKNNSQATPSTKGQVIPAQPTPKPPTAPGNTARPNSDFLKFLKTKPSKQDLHAYLWKQYLKAATGSPTGQLWFKSFKPGPNPVRKAHPGATPGNGSSSISRATSTGQVFTVTTLADKDEGNCGANCSLREAIYAANDAAGPVTIKFNVSGTITLSSLPPYITNKAGVTIDGTGQKVTIHGYNSQLIR